MDVGTFVIIILILIVLFTIIGLIIGIKNKISHISKQIFGTSNILEGFKKQEEELAETPKSVSSLNEVILPKIKKDFPSFNFNEMISIAEAGLRTYFESLSANKIKEISNVTPKFNEKIISTIEENLKKNITYDSFKIHRTVIKSYQNKKGICTITFQSAIEYYLLKDGSRKKIQDRFNTDMIYIYDDTDVKEGYGISLNCQNCGAPIKKLGVKSCPYCGTGIVDLMSKTWKINDIYKS